MRFEELSGRFPRLALALLVLGAGAVARAQAPADFGPPADFTAPGSGADVVFFWNDPDPDAGQRDTIRLSDHWIGVSGTPADEVLRAQLALPEGQGYVVTSVSPDSPAAAAGLEKSDVLLTAAGKNIADLPDLVAVVEAHKGKAIELTLLRAGQRRALEVTPAKRPDAPLAADRPDVRREVDRWIRRMPGGAGRRLQLFGFGPGMMGNRMEWFHAAGDFPKDLSVTVTKEGNTPAKIVAKRGDQEWTVTEDSLDKLPDDVRPHVEGLLGRGGIGVVSGATGPQRWQLGNPGPVGPDFRMRVEPFPGPGGPAARVPAPALEERLEQLNRQLEELRRSLDELRAAPKDAPREPDKT